MICESPSGRDGISSLTGFAVSFICLSATETGLSAVNGSLPVATFVHHNAERIYVAARASMGCRTPDRDLYSRPFRSRCP